MSIQGIGTTGQFSNGLANAFLSGLAGMGRGRGAFSPPLTAIGGPGRATGFSPADDRSPFGASTDKGLAPRIRPDNQSYRGTAYQRSADGDEAFLGSRVGNLTGEERTQVSKLRQRDQQVRAHEQAHLTAAGGLARGGPKFDFTRGPDGRQYAVGGNVQIDTSPAATPEQTLTKAQQMRRAALAPDSPSGTDRRVAAQAAQLAAQARRQIGGQDQPLGTGSGGAPTPGASAATPSAASPGHGADDRDETEAIEEEREDSNDRGGRVEDHDDDDRQTLGPGGTGGGLRPVAPPSGTGTGIKPAAGGGPRTTPVQDAFIGGGTLNLLA